MFKVPWKFNVPNALSILRILLVPVIAVLYLKSKENETLLYWSIAALAVSALSDFFDGIIARRFNQITEFGKLLDPIADKLTQFTVVLCLAIRNHDLIPLLVICFVKELCQAIGGYLLLRRGEKVRAAKWYGKMATGIFYLSMGLMVLFPDMPPLAFWTLIALVVGWMLFAFYNYIKVFLGARQTPPDKN